MHHIKKLHKLRKKKKEKKEKKGISNLVATVLVILLAIVTILIIWMGVIPAIKDSLALNSACTNARLSIDTHLGYTCFDESCKKANIVVSRGTDITELAGMLIGLESGQQTVTYVVKEDPSVVLSFNLDEGTGTNVTDSSVKNNNGIASGTEWGRGRFGSGLEFDSVNDSVSVSQSSTLEIDDGITIEAWVKIESVGTTPFPNFMIGRD